MGSGSDFIVSSCGFLLHILTFFLFLLLLLGAFFLLFLGVFLVDVKVIGSVGSFWTVDLLDTIQDSLIILVQINFVVRLVDHDEAAVILHLWEGLEDQLWHATVVLLMALSSQDQVLLVLGIILKQLANIVRHRVVLHELGLEDVLVSRVGLLVRVMHVAAADHGLKHIVMEVGTFERLEVGGEVVLGDRLFEALGLALAHKGAGVGTWDEAGVELHKVFVLLGMLEDGSVGLEVVAFSADLSIALEQLIHV